jgi:Neuraminidase (sialidase)
LTRLGSRTLGLIYFDRPSHGLEEGDLAALVSRDDGHTWHSAGIASPHAPGENRMHIASGIDRDGRWIVLSTGFRIADGKLVELQPVWCSVAETPGAPWQVRRDVVLRGPMTRPIPHGRIVSTGDGKLAATFYQSEGRGNPSRAWIMFSADGGRTWDDARELGSGDANEVVLLHRDDESWLAAARTQADHHVALYQSDDDARTWTLRDDLTSPMQHPADLTELGANRILLTYGLRTRETKGIGARLSRDGGSTWSEPVTLHLFENAQDCGYPSTVACEDGTLLTACYSDRSVLHAGYHLLTLRWRADDFFGRAAR